KPLSLSGCEPSPVRGRRKEFGLSRPASEGLRPFRPFPLATNRRNRASCYSVPNHCMSRRISGIETEYGCLVDDPHQDPKQVLPPIRDWLFEKHRYGLIDQHERDWDAPAGNGGFLFNGGRVYIDMEHIEYCTPECVSVADVVRYDRAGDLLLLDAVRALGLRQKVHFIRNNVDHY